MRSIHLFDLASRHNQWLSMRQSVVAGNIANANTPGYRSLELQPFEVVLESANLQMAVTERGHMAPDATAATPTNEVEGGRTWDVYR
ncbi:MAG TPA: flagellar basal body protein, partial [Hyphomicrobiales bacterium]